MSKNEQTIWVAQMGHGGEEAFLLRQTAYSNHLGRNYAQAWRAQSYVQDCEKKGETATKIPPAYDGLHLYHLRRSRTLDESVSLKDQDVRDGDVFVLTTLPDNYVDSQAKNYGIPDAVDPKKRPYGNRLPVPGLWEPASSAAQNPASRAAQNNPWIAGSFYLASVCIVMAILGVLSHIVSPLALSVVLIAGPLLVIVVGVLTLRNIELLKDKPFTELLLAVINSLPLFRWFGRAASKTKEPSPRSGRPRRRP